MVKPFVAIISLGLGASAAGGLVWMQANPDAFTRTAAPSTVPLAEALTVRPVAPPVTVADNTLASTRVQIPEVQVVGYLSPRLLHPRRATPVKTAPVEAKATPEVKVIAPPCVDGQYRELDPGHGVRMMCPHPAAE